MAVVDSKRADRLGISGSQDGGRLVQQIGKSRRHVDSQDQHRQPERDQRRDRPERLALPAPASASRLIRGRRWPRTSRQRARRRAVGHAQEDGRHADEDDRQHEQVGQRR